MNHVFLQTFTNNAQTIHLSDLTHAIQNMDTLNEAKLPILIFKDTSIICPNISQLK